MALPRIDYALFDLKIPSTGKTIRLRSMLVKDERILLMAKPANPNVPVDISHVFSAIKQIVQNCIVTPGVNTDDFAMFDLEFVFIKLRENSVGPTFDTSYNDVDEINLYEQNLREGKQSPLPEAYKFTVDLSKVEVKFINTNMTIDGPNDIKIQMTYPKATLYNDQEFQKLGVREALEELIRQCIKSVNGETGTKEELKVWLDDLPIQTNDKLLEWVQNLPKLNYELTYTNKLGKERKIILNTLSDFFSF